MVTPKLLTAAKLAADLRSAGLASNYNLSFLYIDRQDEFQQ